MNSIKLLFTLILSQWFHYANAGTHLGLRKTDVFKLLYEDSLTNDITNTKIIKEGIYLTFKDFRENSPSISLKNLDCKFLEIEPRYNFYRFTFLDSLNKQINFNQEIWGFSIGNVVFLNSKQFKTDSYLNPNAFFIPLFEIGRYCYFSNAIQDNN